MCGLSQGGVLALYTALHTKYELGGFIPIVTWLPLLLQEPPAKILKETGIVNQDTPILQMNGGADMIVPNDPAGMKTRAAMEKVYFKFLYYFLLYLLHQVYDHYKFELIPGTGHLTTAPSQITMPIIRKWLKANTKIKFEE